MKRQLVTLTLGAVAAVVLAGVLPAAAHLPSGKLVDLTHSFDADTIYWPTADGFRLEKEHDGVTDKGYYYAANKFCAAEHGGTHVDAPIHFNAKGRTVDALPLEQLIAPGILVNVVNAARASRDYRVAVRDFEEWEARYGQIPRGAIVLLRTDYAAFWRDRRRYLGTDRRGPRGVKELHFPGLHADAARWLVAERGVAAVGIDTASIDLGRTPRFETHVALSEQQVPAFENLANLDQLPPKNFTVVALPMKIRGGSGAPLRIVAIIGN
jgi:kynurenine formamidase